MKKPLDAMAAVFQALGDPTRLRILGLLLTGEVCVCHIHESLRIPQPKASRHLAYLRRAGLVDTRRDGLWVYYRFAESRAQVDRTIRHAITHALGDIETVRQDTGRLQKKTGACLPVVSQVGPPVVVDRLPRRRRGLPSGDYSERSKIHPAVAPNATIQVGLIE